MSARVASLPGARGSNLARGAAWSGLLSAAVAAPFLLASYEVFQLATAMTYVPVVAGLMLLTGVGGQVSLGHGALFGIGAYTAAILVEHAGLPFLAAVPAAIAVTALAGVLIGLPALRLHGMQLALVTAALAIVFTPLLLRFEGLTGGVAGLSLGPVSAPGWAAIDPDQWAYLCALAAALASLLAVAAVLRSRLGLALRAVEADELGAQAAGVDVARAKTQAFALSAALAGAAGALYAYVVGFVAPESFPLLLGIAFLVGMVVGGSGSVAGPLAGALFIEFGPSAAANVGDEFGGIVYGVAVVVIVLVLPGGIVSLGARLRRLSTGATHRLRPRPESQAPKGGSLGFVINQEEDSR
jgi:branched-chain amino acid transport system permease protein